MAGEVDDVGSSYDANISEELVNVPNYKRPGTTSIDFDGLLSPPLLLHEDLTRGCGGQTWPAGMVLAKYLLRKSDSLSGKKILELGAGGGLVGLALAIALFGSRNQFSNPQPTLQITDQEPMLRLMEKNISLNNMSQDQITASILDWGTPAEGFLQPDVLIAAECVYFEPAFPLLLQTMSQLIGPRTICYFCFKKRRKADSRFMKDARKRFKVVEVTDDPDKHIWSREGLFFYVITAKLDAQKV